MSLQINLFNPAFQKKKQIFSAQTMLQALVVVLVGTLALIMFGRHSVDALEREASSGAEQLRLSTARLASVLVEFAPRKKSPELEQQIIDAQAGLAALREVTDVLSSGKLGNTDGYSEYFVALARQRTGHLWLTGVSITGAGHAIGLQGRALDPALVPAFITRLTREPVLQGTSFGSLQISRAALKGGSPEAAAGAIELAPYLDFSLQSAPPETK